MTGVWNAKPDQKIVDGHWAGHNFTAIRAALVPANPLQVALGRPNREQVVTVRGTVATTLEALELTNGGELTGRLKQGSEALLARTPEPGPRDLVDEIYLNSLGRSPTRAERKLALPLVGKPVRKEGVEDLLWAVTMLPEFQLIY